MNGLLQAALDYHARGWCILPVKGKQPACRWKGYQTKRPDLRTLHRWFRGNTLDGLGVLAGDVSGGLVCRDFDQLESYKRWASEQPELAVSLPTVKTRRGCHVYFVGVIRRIVHLPDGELRGNGFSVLPPSRHPLGTVYEWVVPLPDGLLPEIDPFAVGLVQDVTERAETAERIDAIGLCVPYGTLDEAISATLPRGEGERNRRIFDFARALKSMPEYADADPCGLRELVRRWHEGALPVIRTKPFDDTWFDFLYAWGKVKFPLGGGPMAQAVARALENDPPAVAQKYERPELRLLVALCRELQRATGEGPFFLSCWTAARLLGVAQMTAWRWLCGLEADGVLVVVEKGGRSNGPGRATRFRYIAAED